VITESTKSEVVGKVRSSVLRGRELRAAAMRELAELEHYNWVGVYRLDGEVLKLDEYYGAPTDHTEIPVGRGVCGTAVAEGRNQVIEDVTQLDNYLSCSIETRAEIVVLIRDLEGRTLGQIDVDGHAARCFDASDEAMLEEVAAILAERWA
jgi:L-methionine (R)-S-oxide reductase